MPRLIMSDLANLNLAAGECGRLLVDAGDGRDGPAPSSSPPPRLAVHGADHVPTVVQLDVALAVGPSAPDVGLSLREKKVFISHLLYILKKTFLSTKLYVSLLFFV